jgi:hypothetical protein
MMYSHTNQDQILVILPSSWNLSKPACKTVFSGLASTTSQAKIPFSLNTVGLQEKAYAFLALFIVIAVTIYTSKGQEV